MANPTTLERFRGLSLCAADLQEMTNWPAPLIEDYLNLLDNIEFLGSVIDIQGENSTRISFADSPYTVLDSDRVLVCDTDLGPMEILLPTGTEGRELVIKNVGTSSNDVTLTPNGAETIKLTTLYDGETLDTYWDSVEYWV